MWELVGSFLYFYNTSTIGLLQDGIFHKKIAKISYKKRIDKGIPFMI